MSNRILWLIILCMFILAGYLYYYMEYIPQKEANIAEEVEKQKQAVEVKKEPKLTKQIVEKVEISNAEKIEELKKKKNNYKVIKLENSSNTYFKEEDNSLDLYLDDKKIWSFELVYSEYLRVETIVWTQNDLYIEVWKNKYYYNFNTGIITLIELNIDVEYVKYWTDNSLIFVTTKWSFVYSFSSKSLEYFSFFNDFVYFDDWYVWIVREDEKRILNNLWFEGDNNLIVYYNPTTKEKNIVFKTDLDIKKLYNLDWKVYIVTDKWEKFELENIK